MYINYPWYLSDFNENLILSKDFRKILKTSNFKHIRQIGAELFYEEGHTDMTQLVVAFRNFGNARKNKCKFYIVSRSCNCERLFSSLFLISFLSFTRPFFISS
jgi:hypothetical protein